MIRLSFLLVVCFPLLSQSVWAQRPAGQSSPTPSFSPGELKVTPEMWLYEQQMRQYLNPKLALRAREEFVANQRQRRLAAMRWFGISNSRPRWSADVYNWDQSPGWASNNPAYPYRWQAVGQPWYLAQPPRFHNGMY